MVWTLGDVVREVRGGICRSNGRPSVQTLPGIIACGGDRLTPPRQFHRLSNPALFSRDAYTCMNCGNRPGVGLLTRDHVQPKSRGGQDRWENVVTACRRCNQFKSNRTPQEARMQLLELPFRPNNAEFLALINERQNFCPATGFFTQPVFSQQSSALSVARGLACFVRLLQRLFELYSKEC